MEAKIKEIFDSIQGEGPIIGFAQIFIRFCGCNLTCDYCDTDFTQNENTINFTPAELYKFLKENFNLNLYHSLSLTGGEPLLQIRFLKEFLPMISNEIPIYLETNATLKKNLKEIKPYIDTIGADIKLPSCSNQNTFNEHKEFFKDCEGTKTFAKIVFDKNITPAEIAECANIGKEYNIELILQPKMQNDIPAADNNFCLTTLHKFLEIHHNCRLIPQTHKFLNIR